MASWKVIIAFNVKLFIYWIKLIIYVINNYVFTVTFIQLNVLLLNENTA